MANTSPFGAVAPRDGAAFRERLNVELGRFLCGDAEYAKEREGLFGADGIARTYVVSTVAVAIAPALGVSATFLAPAVALGLAAVAKVTLNAWCAGRDENSSDDTIDVE